MTRRFTIGVMGSASGTLEDAVLARCTLLGLTIAERGCTIITGACPGLSYAAVQGAKEAGGLVVGISPGHSLDEHVVKHRSPVDSFDVLIYTGSGLMGREILEHLLLGHCRHRWWEFRYARNGLWRAWPLGSRRRQGSRYP